MIRLLLLALALFASIVFAQSLPATCGNDGSLIGRTDVVWCERFETSTWWSTNEWKEDGRKTSPIAATSADETEITSTGCISGNCLKVNCLSYTLGGCSGAIAHQKPIPGTLDEVYARYYIKMASNWSPANFDTGGGSTDSGGKWPGLADPRTDADSSGQCGNGGDAADGINCWSGRLKYRDCLVSGNADGCTADIHGSSATTRIGWYWYTPDAHQDFGAFDNVQWGTPGGPCSSTDGFGSTGSDATSCGKGTAGLINNHWYLVEIYIKMNTPGSANGIARAWINGTLKYEKTNLVLRNVGHDGLHVRNFWLNVHAGGDIVGPATTTHVLIDEIVVVNASGWGGDMSQRPGAWLRPGTTRTTSSTVTVSP